LNGRRFIPGAVLLLSLAGAAPAGAQSAPAQRQIEAAKLSKVPKLKKKVEAVYPPGALEKGVEGDVVLLLDIGADGKVTSVGIAEPATPPGLGFEEAAVLAAQQFEFEPAEVEGQPIAVQINYHFKFKPPTKAPPPPPPPPAAAPPTAAAEPPPPAPVAPSVINFAGTLRERGTRLPLAGVLVTVFRDDGEKPQGFEATSDEKGTFHFVDLSPGPWKVLIDPPGYYPFRTTEEIHRGEKTQATYYVEKGVYNPYDVTVTAVRPRKEVSRTVITAQEIDKVPGTAGDPLTVVQNFAGVARAPLLSGLIIVRGSAPNDTKVFADGAEIPLVYHFGGLRSVIPIGLIDGLVFIPGNFSPMYGRATGGIIDIQIKKLTPKKVGGYLDVSILDSSLYVEVPITEKFAMAAAVRRSYLDILLNAAVPSDSSINLITAPRYYDYQLLANYRPAPAHDFRAMLMGSDDRFAVLFKDPGDVGTQITGNSASLATTFYRSILTYRYTPSDRFENFAQISQGRDHNDANVGQLVLNVNQYSSQMRDNARLKVAPWATVSLGLDVVYQKTDLLVRLPRPPSEGEPPPTTLDTSKLVEQQLNGLVRWLPAAFGELELKPIPSMLLLPGVRVDHYSSVDDTVIQPRFTLRHDVTARFTWKGGVGLFSQEPQPWESDVKFGNPALKAERVWHYSLGAEYRPLPYLTLDATGFYKDMRNLVSNTTAQAINPDGTTRALIYDNNGRGRAYGLELQVKHEFSHNFTGWLVYTLSRSERRDSGQTTYRLFDFDQTHILAVLGSYQFPRNWIVGGRFRYVSGDPITPVTGSVWNASSDEYSPVYGAVNSGRLGAFHQLDLRVDKKWIFPRWILDVYLDIQNVYNRSNPEGISYNFDFRQQKVQQGLPILPILGVRGDL
jgi:TonB family protein